MANYQELIVKAISSLTENNGAARREVYEKARKALVTQLRAVEPALAPREITQHRLELEDCIRHVEQQATEKILGGLQELDEVPEAPVAPAASSETSPPSSAPDAPSSSVSADVSAAIAEAVVADAAIAKAKAVDVEPDNSTIDAIIARAEAAQAEQAAPKAAAVPEPVAAVATDSVSIEVAAPKAVEPAPPSTNPTSNAPAVSAPKVSAPAVSVPVEPKRNSAKKSTKVEPAIETPASPETQAAPLAQPVPSLPEATPIASAVAKQRLAALRSSATQQSDAAVGAAMSRVREVEVEAPGNGGASANNGSVPNEAIEQSDAQLVVDRALEALNREALGTADEEFEADQGGGDDFSAVEQTHYSEDPEVIEETYLVSGTDEEKGGGALTIFLILAVVLLGAVGGGGYWAWQAGYVDLDALFAQVDPIVADGSGESENSITPNPDGTGPGNTATNAEDIQAAEQLAAIDEADKLDERLPQTAEQTADIAAPAGDDDKAEDRLDTGDSAVALTIDGQNDQTAAVAGAQSLLLEALPGGTTGAVPFSGTVSWSRGVDELGQPTLIGNANIPARNLSVEVLIRRNADPTLPASHLVEIQFETSETFVGGTIASFGGILLKNEELVPGTSLVGAPARVFENMFLFALNSDAQDLQTNVALLETNKWMDLALVYATGRQAIVTLEKDAEAEALFSEVIAIWGEAANQ